MKKQKVVRDINVSIFHHAPVLQCIMNHLPLISVLSLKRAFKLKFINGYREAKERYVRYLLHLGVRPRAIDILFKQGFDNAFTGSTLLKVLCGAEWNCGDIDLVIEKYVPMYAEFAHMPVIQELYQNECLLPVLHDPIVYLKTLTDTSVYGMHDDENFPEMLKCIYEYNLADIYDPSLQVLHIVTSISSYVETFDFTFCRNFLSSDRLVITDPVAVLRQECTIENGKKERVKKYADRGFKIK